jgi:ubiquinone/menaquinone biosynthesis C-methylase UbiE
MHQKDYWVRETLGERRSPEHPVVAEYVTSRINELRPYVDILPDTRLLDVGCGNGFFTFYFDRICDVYGIDYSKKMLQMNPVKKTLIMDANNLGFGENSFDIVFCHALLHHVENPHKVIQEMKRASKRYVVILEPNRNNPLMFLFSLLVKEERNALKSSLSYLRDLLVKNDLRVIASFSYGMIVPNKTPSILLPVLKLFNFKQPLGMTNFVIAIKDQ